MAKGSRILEFVENDLLPFIAVEWDGEDITGFNIFLHIRRPNKTKVSKTAIIDDPNTGGLGTALFHFELAAGDLCVGDSPAEIETFDGPLNETFQGLILRTSEEIS